MKVLPCDVARCTDSRCPARMQCMRYLSAIRDLRESATYADFGRMEGDIVCESFIAETTEGAK